MLRAALPVLIAVLSFPVAARAQPGAPDPGPPPEAGPPPADPGAEPSGEDAMCWRGHCGPDRPRRFAVELELARAELDDDAGTARTGGIALEKFFCTHRRLNPYLAAGAGGGRFERPDATDSRLGYGELGGGLMLRGRRFALALDLRAGARRLEQAEVSIEPGVAAAMTSPGDDDDDEWERERYHRARLMLLLQF